uniref:Putative secreted protein n=1 Tax=Anopheles marajoara TaxID=58244 RepID=A0A2M4C8X2_9DIPT
MSQMARTVRLLFFFSSLWPQCASFNTNASSRPPSLQQKKKKVVRCFAAYQRVGSTSIKRRPTTTWTTLWCRRNIQHSTAACGTQNSRCVSIGLCEVLAC